MMLLKALKRIMALWQGLAEREKRLAMLTGIVVAITAVFVAYQSAAARLGELDVSIGRLEDALTSYTMQMAHREMVEARYAAVAAQHSSAWTEAEIHDRLRQEIYRLARNVPQALDENGIPVNVPNENGNLVEIPSLGKGSMAEGGKGYREYMINLRIPPCPLDNIVNFLERLQSSPQTLRIDGLELNRSPDGDLLAASIDICRIVADGAASAPSEASSPESGMGRIQLQANAWDGVGVSFQDADSQSAHGAVDMRAAEANAEAYMVRSLPAGETYEMVIDLAAGAADVRLGVGLESDEKPFEGVEIVPGDGSGRRYQVQFTLPGSGGALRVRCPWLLLGEEGNAIQAYNLLLRKVSEG